MRHTSWQKYCIPKDSVSIRAPNCPLPTYSLNVGEEEFCELRLDGVLGSSQGTGPIHRLALLRTERYLAEPRAKQYANARACGSEPLSFVALLGDVPVAAASLGHLGGLLPPTLGVALHPHVHVPLRAGVAAPRASFETALPSSSSASAHSVPLLVGSPSL